MTKTQTVAVGENLKSFIRHHAVGGCRSLSGNCACPLCDVDALLAEVTRLEAETAESKAAYLALTLDCARAERERDDFRHKCEYLEDGAKEVEAENRKLEAELAALKGREERLTTRFVLIEQALKTPALWSPESRLAAVSSIVNSVKPLTAADIERTHELFKENP